MPIFSFLICILKEEIDFFYVNLVQISNIFADVDNIENFEE